MIKIIRKIFKSYISLCFSINGGTNQLKHYYSFYHSSVRAKIAGVILLAIGIAFFINPTSLNIKMGFASILIGIFVIFMLTKNSVPKTISDDQIKGNITAVKQIIEKLHLKGNAVFLPKTAPLTEERVLIPPNNMDVIQIPDIADDDVFLTRAGGRNLGISMPPSGLKLLKKIEKEAHFENTEVKDIEDKLQKFVGIDLIDSLSFTKHNNGWILEFEKPYYCPNDENLCKQYPCPTCSAILTAITRTADGSQCKLWIKDVKHNGGKMAFHLHFIKKRTTREDTPC